MRFLHYLCTLNAPSTLVERVTRYIESLQSSPDYGENYCNSVGIICTKLKQKLFRYTLKMVGKNNRAITPRKACLSLGNRENQGVLKLNCQKELS